MKLIILLCFFSFNILAARCNYRLNLTDYRTTWNGSSIDERLPLSVQSFGSVNSFLCYLYFYDFGKGNAGNYSRYMINSNGDRLFYNIYNTSSSNNILVELEDMSQNSDAIRGQAYPWGRSYSNELELKISGNSIDYPAGTYTDSINVGLYSGRPFFSPEKEQTSLMNYSVTIQSDINVSLVDAGGTYDQSDTYQEMDFGELQQGETQQADLIVVANTGYEIFFSSENRGRLKHTTKNDRISYTAKLDGNRVNLKKRNGVRVISSDRRTSQSGQAYRISIEIGSVNNKANGLYTDSIYITAEAK